MRKGEATRARILDQVTTLVATRGLTAVSLADVAEAVGLSKSGLFKHFVSKDDMHLAVIEAVMDHFTDWTWTPVLALPPGRARLEDVFVRWMDWEELEWPACGCPIMAFSVELDDQPGPLHDYLKTRLGHWRRALVNEFRLMRDPPLSQAEAEAGYFQMKSFALGHFDARRMMGDENARHSAMQAFGDLLDRVSRRAA